MEEITEQKPRTRKPKSPKPLDIPETEPKAFDVETFEPKPEVPELEEEIKVEEKELLEETKEPESEIAEETPAAGGDLAEQPAAAPEDFANTLSGPAEICKVNPNLPDDRSKWTARLVAEKGYHILFKGSFAKAYRVADNYNVSHGFPAKKIRRIAY